MAGSYTTNYSLYKPAGREVLWQTLVNVNFDTIDTTMKAHADLLALKASAADMATALAEKAALSHTHAQSDVTNLVSALAAKAALSHTHTWSQITGSPAAGDVMCRWAQPQKGTYSGGTGINNRWGTHVVVGMITVSGTYRITFTIDQTTFTTATGYGTIYKNLATAVGTERSVSAGNSNTFTEDVSLSAGDLISIYAEHLNSASTSCGVGYINFKIKANAVYPIG